MCPAASLPGCGFHVAAYFGSAGSVKRTSSTWQILKEIWAELGYRGLFTGGADARLQPLRRCLPAHRCEFLLRVPAQSVQSGPGLRHHDQHLRVWEVLLPGEEPGQRESSDRKPGKHKPV